MGKHRRTKVSGGVPGQKKEGTAWGEGEDPTSKEVVYIQGR